MKEHEAKEGSREKIRLRGGECKREERKIKNKKKGIPGKRLKIIEMWMLKSCEERVRERTKGRA